MSPVGMQFPPHTKILVCGTKGNQEPQGLNYFVISHLQRMTGSRPLPGGSGAAAAQVMSASGWDLPSCINGGSWSGRTPGFDKEPPTSPNALTMRIRHWNEYPPALTHGIEEAERRTPLPSGFPI